MHALQYARSGPEPMRLKRNKNKGLEQFCFDKLTAQPYHTAPMSGGLPEYLDLTKAGNTPLMVAGNLSLSRMPRLCAALADSGGQVSVDLQLFKEGGLAVVSGRVQASLGLTCQRCFRPMRYPVDATMRDRKSTRLNSSHQKN